MSRIQNHAVYALLAVVGVFAFGTIALNRGEPVNAIWVVAATLATYLIAFRYHSLYLATRVAQLDANRLTPAVRLNDGLDYVPTNRYVLFGHHFAAIAGAGPLVGPVLAAQMGYLPGMLWILAGVVLAGAVQDFMILFISTRRDGRSLGEMVKAEMGEAAGLIALFGTFMIMIIILAVLALIVVKALTNSPWGMFTVVCTVPIAVLMGVWMRFVQPGRIGAVSVVGFLLLIGSIVLGGEVAANPTFAPLFTFTGTQLAWILIAYGFIAAALPVWLLLAPRDYLSTFLKIGTITALAIGIVFVRPDLRMPALTQFVDGSGPVWSGALFPFLFITIACGAVSGFHALISSGTTPKMVMNETDIRFIGYGAMLMESFVAIMALTSASVIDPGVYFGMNAPPAIVGATAESAAQKISGWGFAVTPDALTEAARDVGEKTLLARAGGAPTLAVGMSQILSNALGGRAMMAFWYHFAILFEALFILTAVDAGTRAGRFMLQDLLGAFAPMLKDGRNWVSNGVATALTVFAWGYFLYQGVVDPLGGINTLWPLFGISNQMLAAIALILASVVLFKMKRERYAWTTRLPAGWLLVCTLTAGLEKILHLDPKIGFMAHAFIYHSALNDGKVLAPAKSLAEMSRIVINDYVDTALCMLFVLVVVSMVVFGIRSAAAGWRSDRPTAVEAMPAGAAVA
jgi:carbon starvation protein